MSAPKSLMTHYLEGALISRELHDMMHQYAADARFEAELKGYEDRYSIAVVTNTGRGRKRVSTHEGNADEEILAED